MSLSNPKVCVRCAVVPVTGRTRYCVACKIVVAKAGARRRSQECRKRQGKNVGVGSGAHTRMGKNNSQYKTGIAYFLRTRRYEIRQERKNCERCSVNLLDVKPGFWAVHHKDHDRGHNEDSNYELLCKRCHQIEHECWTAFQKSNDYPVMGVGNSVPEAQGTL